VLHAGDRASVRHTHATIERAELSSPPAAKQDPLAIGPPEPPLKAKPAERARLRPYEPMGPPAPTPPPPAVGEAESEVHVIAPPLDPIEERWQRASRAFYQERNAPEAIALAEGLLKDGGARPEVSLARDLLCEAYVSIRDPDKAVAACERVLAATPDDEGKRAMQYRVGMLYRTLVKDCRQAIPHFSAAIVFGGRTLVDEQALIGRANCALDLGDLATAERDVAMLERHAETLVQTSEFVELKERLAALMSAEPRGK
jgi:hypothetical protein